MFLFLMFDYILLAVGFVVFLISWYYPIPYGRFSTSKGIPNRWFIGLANLPVLVCLAIKLPEFTDFSSLGKAAFVFLCIHFVFRSILVPVITGFIYYTDEKQNSFTILSLFMLYNVIVGITLADMCSKIESSFLLWLDLPLLIAAGAAWLLNIYYDIQVNWMRCHAEEGVKDMYVTLKGLENEFPLLVGLNITSPNYFFEIIEWAFFLLLTWRTESFAYFIATWLILWVRALEINMWLEGREKNASKNTVSVSVGTFS